MPSVRSSFSLDPLRDHELLEWLAELQADGRASDVIRTALNEHRKTQPTLADVVSGQKDIVARLERIEERFASVSLQSSVVKGSEAVPVPAADDELERRLEKTLGRFRRD